MKRKTRNWLLAGAAAVVAGGGIAYFVETRRASPVFFSPYVVSNLRMVSYKAPGGAMRAGAPPSAQESVTVAWAAAPNYNDGTAPTGYLVQAVVQAPGVIPSMQVAGTSATIPGIIPDGRTIVRVAALYPPLSGHSNGQGRWVSITLPRVPLPM